MHRSSVFPPRRTSSKRRGGSPVDCRNLLLLSRSCPLPAGSNFSGRSQQEAGRSICDGKDDRTDRRSRTRRAIRQASADTVLHLQESQSRPVAWEGVQPVDSSWTLVALLTVDALAAVLHPLHFPLIVSIASPSLVRSQLAQRVARERRPTVSTISSRSTH